MRQKTDKPVIVIGGINADLTGYCQESHVLGTSNPGQVKMNPGGVARNIAHDLSLLGVPVRLLGVVGDDSLGFSTLKATELGGVDLSGVEILKGRATGTYLSILDSNRELVTALSDMDILDAIPDNIIKAWVAALSECSFLVLDTNLPQTVLDHLIREAVSRQIKVIIDPVSMAKSRKLLGLRDKKDKIFCVTPNEDEYLALSGDYRESRLPPLGSHSWQPLFQAEYTVITRGGENVVLLGLHEYLEFPVFPVKIADVNGAGDAFTAGLVSALYHGLPVQEAVPRAIAASAIVLESYGCVNPLLSQQLLQRILQEKANR